MIVTTFSPPNTMKLKIKNPEIRKVVQGETLEFPKYATQIINLANSNAQGTRPQVVGQLSDLIQEFGGGSLKEWEEWYTKKKPDGVEQAVARIYPMILKFREVIQEIDEDMVRTWAKDLIITKTYTGLRFQEAILAKVAEKVSGTYRLSTPAEESRGIDGFINDRPVSIKPSTYKVKILSEEIEQPIIFYDKRSDGISMELPEEFR